MSRARLAIFAIAIGYILNPINCSMVVTAYRVLTNTFGVRCAHMCSMVINFMAATAAVLSLGVSACFLRDRDSLGNP